MTAEIGIMNKHGVVLAADSAVTVNGGKVYNTAKKIFTLNPAHSIGLMIYGNGNLMGVPWEVLIQRFSKKISDDTFGTVEEYAEEFLEYLKSEPLLEDENAAIQYVHFFSKNLLLIVTEYASQQLNRYVENGEAISDELLIDIISKVIAQIGDSTADNEEITSINQDEFNLFYGDIIKLSMQSVVNVRVVVEEMFEAFKNLVYLFINRSNEVASSSGVVIAGYGDSEAFPSLYSFEFQGKILGELIYSKKTPQKVDVTPFPKREETEQDINRVTSSIIPFAQKDVVQTVLTGIAPEITEKLFDLLTESCKLKSEDIKKLLEELNDYQRKEFVDKMVNTVEILQINELADVAETLVNLTGFKRKYTSDIPTVGGPVDVLAISLGEGPIWIKRKHYFDTDKNLGFKIRKERY